VLKDGVVAVLKDAEGRYLLIRRGAELRRAPGVWCFVGGEVEAGETFAQAVEREVREEVGLRVRSLGKVHESLSPGGEYRLHWLAVQELDTGVLPVAHPVEVAELRWLTPAEALRLEPMLPALRAWLQLQSKE
jgi:8-oxo-dGTP diphosphatase